MMYILPQEGRHYVNTARPRSRFHSWSAVRSRHRPPTCASPSRGAAAGPTIATCDWWSAVVADLAERRAFGPDYSHPIPDRVLHQLPAARPIYVALLATRALC